MLAASGSTASGMRLRQVARDQRPANCDDLIGQFDLVRSGLAPSHWMTRGVMAAARGDLAGALLPLALVWSNGLLLVPGRGMDREARLPHRATTASPAAAAARRSTAPSRSTA